MKKYEIIIYKVVGVAKTVVEGKDWEEGRKKAHEIAESLEYSKPEKQDEYKVTLNIGR